MTPWIVVPNVGSSLWGRAWEGPLSRFLAAIIAWCRVLAQCSRRTDSPSSAGCGAWTTSPAPTTTSEPMACRVSRQSSPSELASPLVLSHSMLGRVPVAMTTTSASIPSPLCSWTPRTRPAWTSRALTRAFGTSRTPRSMCTAQRCRATWCPSAREVGVGELSTRVATCPAVRATDATSAPIRPPPTMTTRHGGPARAALSAVPCSTVRRTNTPAASSRRGKGARGREPVATTRPSNGARWAPSMVTYPPARSRPVAGFPRRQSTSRSSGAMSRPARSSSSAR